MFAIHKCKKLTGISLLVASEKYEKREVIKNGYSIIEKNDN